MSVTLATKRRSAVNLLRYLATGVLVVAALVAARYGWRVYVTSPWTRDGMVRVQVANVAPQISGQIVEVRTSDNQHVHKGDILYVIEKFDFEVALVNAKATILTREADLEVKKAQNARRAALTTLSTSVEEKQVFDGNAKMAEAALAGAKAAFSQAEINLQRTEVRSPVDGYVTNLLMRVGDSARVGTPNVSAIPWRRRCWAFKIRSRGGSRASQAASVLRTRQAARKAFQTSIRSLPGFGLRNEFRCASGSNKSLRMCRSSQE